MNHCVKRRDRWFRGDVSAMSGYPTSSGLRRVSSLTKGAGALFIAAGTAAWCAVAKQLRDERITVPGNAPILAGKRVQGPVTAYVEAHVIKGNAERSADGRTFADISDELRGLDGSSDEARQLRSQSSALSAAASLRTSLLTSVLAFGVSALVAGLGVFFVTASSVMRGANKK